MTPRQWADTVSIVVDAVGDPRDPQNYVNDEDTRVNLAAAVRAAVAEEREACIAAMEAAGCDDTFEGRAAIRAIRARGKA